MNNTNRIFLHKLFKAIADSIIKIFIPLYLLKTTGSVELSIAYLIGQSFFTFALMFLTKKLLLKHGLLCMVLHCIPIILTQALFSFCKINLIVVLICSFLMAAAQTLYSIPLNILFASTDKSVNVAKFQISTNIGKLIFILISGLLLSKIPDSFLYLSLLSSLFYIFCIVPILTNYKEIKTEIENNAVIIKNKRKHIEPKKISVWYRVFHCCFGIFQITIEVVVPLFLYLNNLSFEAVTTIIVLVEAIKICTNFVAKIFVSKNKFLVCSLTSTLVFMGCLISIIFCKNPIVLYILSCLISVSFPLCFVPMFSQFCKDIKDNNSINQDMFLRDIDIFAPRSVYYSTFFLTFNFLPCLAIGLAGAIVSFVSQVKVKNKNNI